MKREEDFISSIYEKRDAAVEKRRRTMRIVRRAGVSFASLFVIAAITVAAVFGSGISMSYSAAPPAEGIDGVEKTGKGALHDEKSMDYSYGEVDGAEKQTEATDHMACAETTAAVSLETDVPAHIPENETVKEQDDSRTAAFTEAGIAVEKQRVETVPADGEEDHKKDFESMVTLFGISGESLCGYAVGYGDEIAEVFQILTAKGAMYVFRYKGFYCCVADPDPELTAEKAISIADGAIEERGRDGAE